MSWTFSHSYQRELAQFGAFAMDMLVEFFSRNSSAFNHFKNLIQFYNVQIIQ